MYAIFLIFEKYRIYIYIYVAKEECSFLEYEAMWLLEEPTLKGTVSPPTSG
jgi:hypothetical protein